MHVTIQNEADSRTDWHARAMPIINITKRHGITLGRLGSSSTSIATAELHAGNVGQIGKFQIFQFLWQVHVFHR